MKLHSQKYLSYLNSFDWYLKRRAALERAQNQCEGQITSNGRTLERCKTTLGLEVHHKTYDRLGDEKDEDLQVLCEPCHKIADQKRENDKEYERYQNRVDGWATKKYGEDWHLYMDEQEVTEEFDEWLERKSNGY